MSSSARAIRRPRGGTPARGRARGTSWPRRVCGDTRDAGVTRATAMRSRTARRRIRGGDEGHVMRAIEAVHASASRVGTDEEEDTDRPKGGTVATPETRANRERGAQQRGDGQRPGSPIQKISPAPSRGQTMGAGARTPGRARSHEGQWTHQRATRRRVESNASRPRAGRASSATEPGFNGLGARTRTRWRGCPRCGAPGHDAGLPACGVIGPRRGIVRADARISRWHRRPRRRRPAHAEHPGRAPRESIVVPF